MTRKITDTSLIKTVFHRYNNKCQVCGFSIPQALRVHHILPVSLGGKDMKRNFVLLCSNCHTLVHFFSSKRFIGKSLSGFLKQEYRRTSIERITELAKKVQRATDTVKESNNQWNPHNKNSKKPYSVLEVIASVAHGNNYSTDKANQLQKVLSLVIRHIPANLKTKCSYRLIKKGKGISINMMNYLLFRVPGYPDIGGSPKDSLYDCFLTVSNNVKKTSITKKNIVFKFKHFDCVMLGLSFDEVIALSNADWRYFEAGCKLASQARPSRKWVSNIEVS